MTRPYSTSAIQTKEEEVWFQGMRFIRYPYSTDPVRQNYYRCRKDKKTVYLHRAVWSEVYGPIPDNFVVHHKDENTSNNSVENLEVLSRKEHTRLHTSMHVPEWRKKHLTSKIYLDKWARTGTKMFTCLQCLRQFDSRSRVIPRFCNNNNGSCNHRWHREQKI